MLCALLTTAALSATPATAAIVWGGGKTKADAEKWLKAFNDASAPFKGLYTLPAGHPRLVESAKVKGMKPGFHVVLLGVCSSAELAPRLKLFKSLYAGTYARRVTGEKPACPVIAPKAGVRHTESVTTGDSVLTLSHLETPKGELMRATLMARTGALISTEGFDTPRATATVCLGGFRQVGEAFEVTLCESTKEKNVCCASRKVLALSIDAGKLKKEAGAPKEQPKPAPADDTPCERTPIGDAFVLEVCEAGVIEHGPGFTERTMSASLQLAKGGKSIDLGNWSQGWEWGSKLTAAGTLDTPKGKVLVLQNDSWGEGPGLDSQNSIVTAYGPDLAELWSVTANDVTLRLTGNELHVTTKTVIGGEPEHEDVDEDEFTMSWQDGKLVRKL